MSPQGRAEAHRLWTALESEFERYHEGVRVLPIQQARLQDDLRRYLCLRCAGFLEQVTFEVLSEYLRQKASGPIQEFAMSFFRNSPNLGVEAFESLIARFGEEKAKRFSAFMQGSTRDSLTDLIQVRNLVAHGGYMGGAKLDPARYRDLCEEVHRWLVETFLGSSVEVLDESGVQPAGYENVAR